MAHGGSNPPFRTRFQKGQHLLAFFAFWRQRAHGWLTNSRNSLALAPEFRLSDCHPLQPTVTITASRRRTTRSGPDRRQVFLLMVTSSGRIVSTIVVEYTAQFTWTVRPNTHSMCVLSRPQIQPGRRLVPPTITTRTLRTISLPVCLLVLRMHSRRHSEIMRRRRSRWTGLLQALAGGCFPRTNACIHGDGFATVAGDRPD